MYTYKMSETFLNNMILNDLYIEFFMSETKHLRSYFLQKKNGN